MGRHVPDNVERETRDGFVNVGEVELPLERGAISKIACGKEHVLVLDAKGHVWTWGVNSKG